MADKILLIDIGNTNLKWAMLQDGQLSPVVSQTHLQLPVGSLAESCWSELTAPDHIYLANVAGDDMDQSLSAWMQREWRRTPHKVYPQAEALGVVNGYTDPGQLGVDRWLTLVAIHHYEPTAVCIVDCGTAITIDVITAEGRHLGGMIQPGLDLMRESLLGRTKIPRVGDVPVNQLFAPDTAGAVAAAAVNSAAALVERSVSEAETLCSVRPKLILTGSDAVKIAAALRIPFDIDSGLVMKGLVLIAEAAGGGV